MSRKGAVVEGVDGPATVSMCQGGASIHADSSALSLSAMSVAAAVIILGFLPVGMAQRPDPPDQTPRPAGPPSVAYAEFCPKLLCVVKTAHRTVFARS
jgi:hypothetical protein